MTALLARWQWWHRFSTILFYLVLTMKNVDLVFSDDFWFLWVDINSIICYAKEYASPFHYAKGIERFRIFPLFV